MPAWKTVAMPNHKYLIVDYWQSPDQFENAGGGECVGFAVDLIYHLGPDASFIICNTSFCSSGKKHAIVLYHGHYLEPQICGIYYTIGDGTLLSTENTFSYYEIMSCVTNFGTKDLKSSNSMENYIFTKNPAQKP